MSGCASKLRACKKKHYLPQAGEPPIPLPRWLGGTSTVPTGTSAVPAGTSTNDPATGSFAPTSRVDSTATPSARGDGGAGSQQSEVVLSPSLSSSSEDEFANTNAGGGGGPCCTHSQYSLLYLSMRSYRMILLSFTRAAQSRCCCTARLAT
jgi:hypothetical protein